MHSHPHIAHRLTGYAESGIGSSEKVPPSMPPKASKLCKSFSEIMRDTSSLSVLEYFIQYMESVSALHLVQFWLAVESFKAQRPKTPLLGEKVNHLDSEHLNRPSVASTPMETNCGIAGSPVGDSRAAPRQGEADVEAGATRHRILRRRDTENHKYCNCGIGVHTPPLTHSHVHGTGVTLLPRKHASMEALPLNLGSGVELLNGRTLHNDNGSPSPKLKALDMLLPSMNPTLPSKGLTPDELGMTPDSLLPGNSTPVSEFRLKDLTPNHTREHHSTNLS